MSVAGKKLFLAAQSARAQIRAEAFVRGVLVDLFKQETTDAQVTDIAREVVKTTRLRGYDLCVTCGRNWKQWGTCEEGDCKDAFEKCVAAHSDPASSGLSSEQSPEPVRRQAVRG